MPLFYLRTFVLITLFPTTVFIPIHYFLFFSPFIFRARGVIQIGYLGNGERGVFVMGSLPISLIGIFFSCFIVPFYCFLNRRRFFTGVHFPVLGFSVSVGERLVYCGGFTLAVDFVMYF